jgi:hypothetical protein
MPARYLGIKESLKEKGYSEEEAKTSAAKIYNSTRKHDEPALTPDYEEKHGMSGKKKTANKKK